MATRLRKIFVLMPENHNTINLQLDPGDNKIELNQDGDTLWLDPQDWDQFEAMVNEFGDMLCGNLASDATDDTE